ncbi:MAG: hypothetical protein WBV82_25280, partial [Myxococcaceae bacterium]
MSVDDREWNELISDWKAVDAPPPRMLERARRETRRQWRGLTVELIAGAAVAGFWVRVLWRNPPPVVWFLGLVSIAFVLLWEVSLVRTLRGTWTGLGRSTRDFLALARARREAQLQWLRFVRACLIGAALFGAVWGPWQFFTFQQTYRSEPWRAVVGFGG